MESSDRRSSRSRGRSTSRSRSHNRDNEESDEEPGGWQAFQTGEWCTVQNGKLIPESRAIQLANKSKSKMTNLNDVIVLDSGSTIKATFKSADMVGDVREAATPLEMNTNGGKLIVKQTGVIPKFVRVWYDPRMMANILGLFHMTKKFRCTMDSAVANCINVHTPDGVIKFKASQEGLYCWKPTKKYQDEIGKLKKNDKAVGVSNMVSTVKKIVWATLQGSMKKPSVPGG